MKRTITRRLALLSAGLIAFILLPIGVAVMLDTWEDRGAVSYRLTSIWIRHFVGVTSRETLLVEAASEPDGGTYMRWALRRRADPSSVPDGRRAMDWITHDLGGGCEPPLVPFEILARSGVELDRGADGGLLGFVARACRRPDLVRILLDAGADPALVGGSDDLVRLLGAAAHRPDARSLWAWLLDHDATPCTALGSIDDRASMLRRLSENDLPDLAARAEAACAAKGGGGAGK